MAFTEQDLAGIIQKVLSELNSGTVPAAATAPVDFDGIHEQVETAVACATKAQKALLALPLGKREDIIAALRQTVLNNNEMLAKMAVEETHLGRYEHKIQENILAATKTPGTEDLQPQVKTGDHGMMLLEYAPVGVIGSLTPVTNPTGTVIHNTISMIAAGNAVIFNPHPSAVKTSATILRLLHKTIVDHGGPAGLISAIAKPTLDTAGEIINHPGIQMLVATGGKPVVRAVLSSGKKAIGAGAGNPPVLVDETAHLRQAAQCIVDGASINNNIFCTCEKEVIVVDEVAETLIKFMVETGKAYLLSPQQAEQITKVVLTDKGKVNTKMVGRDVQVILREIGIELDETCRIAIFEADRNHPLVWTEQLMPILPIVRVADIREGIELGVAVEQGNRHTAIMHSTNVDNLTAFARAVQTTIFVKNGPAFAGIGLGGEGHAAFTIAGPTGEGMTSARSFTRQRRCTLVEGFRII